MQSFKSRLSSTTESRWLLGIVGIGLLVRLAAILLYPHTPESDEIAYLGMAKSLVAGHGLVDLFGNRAYYNMGYAFFVLAPVHYLFHDNLLALRLANLACAAASIVLVHAVAREAGGKMPTRLLAALLWALYLPSALYGVYLAKENLMIPLMLGVVWCALRMLRAFQLGIAVLCGLLFGLLALTGNAALALAAAVGIALVLSRAGRAARLLSVPAILLAGALVTTPWLVRNVHVLGAPVLNTNGGFNLYIGNNPAATGSYVSIKDTPRGPTWNPLVVRVGEAAAAETLKREAIAWIAAHPARFLQLAALKLGLFWTPPSHDIGAAKGLEAVVRMAWLVEYLVLAGAVLLGLKSLRERGAPTVLWTSVAAYTGVHMLFFAVARYREPIMPVICVLAAPLLQQAAVRILRFKRPLPEASEQPAA